MEIHADISSCIGKTPLVDLSRLCEIHNVQGKILAKLEYLNPGFSKKDRIAKEIILLAKKDECLKEGQTVVELTSGNTGTGLAIVCSILGHPFVAVMSEGNSQERARMMSALGAEVVIVPQVAGGKPGQVSGDDLQLVEERTREIVLERSAFRADQFHHKGNLLAHYNNTGPELWEQSGHSITVFCDFCGTGGSLGGCALYLKEQDPNVKVYGVEPKGAAVLQGNTVTNPGHRIQGGGYVMKQLEQIELSRGMLLEKGQPGPLIDGFVTVSDDDAMKISRDLARHEGIFGGLSAGANVAAAIHLLKNETLGATVAVLICDSGLKYLSTDLWE